MRHTLVIAVILSISAPALAYEVRSYNEDGKTFHGTFNCSGTKTAAEIRPGTTSLSTNADGTCELTVDGVGSITLHQGDKIKIKNGALTKAD